MACQGRCFQMNPYEKSYRCSVCRWQGQLEPIDAGDAAPCPQCGVYLYPLTWLQTWGAVLAIIGAMVAAVVAAGFLMR
jgi:DNA-directed RNA polymerase subunit RPC12/RpoP